MPEGIAKGEEKTAKVAKVESTNTKDAGEKVETGDDFNMVMAMMLLIISLGTVVMVLRKENR